MNANSNIVYSQTSDIFLKMVPSLFLTCALCHKAILFPTRIFVCSSLSFWYRALSYFSLRHFFWASCARIFVRTYFHLWGFIIRAPRYVAFQHISFMINPISFALLPVFSFCIYVSDEDVSKRYLCPQSPQ